MRVCFSFIMNLRLPRFGVEPPTFCVPNEKQARRGTRSDRGKKRKDALSPLQRPNEGRRASHRRFVTRWQLFLSTKVYQKCGVLSRGIYKKSLQILLYFLVKNLTKSQKALENREEIWYNVYNWYVKNNMTKSKEDLICSRNYPPCLSTGRRSRRHS